jgi:tRNA threonylcarbamoyladenosine biosynthesis protein TsaB
MTASVLALESGGELASVALMHRGKLTFATAESGQSHSSRLLPLAQDLLASAGITWSSLDGIAVGVGPGSFTGLRVACGIAQGLSLASGKQLLPVNLFDTVAYAWWSAHSPNQDDRQVFRISFDARLGERFAAAVKLTQSSNALSLEFVAAPEVVLDATAHPALNDPASATPADLEQSGPADGPRDNTHGIIHLRDPDVRTMGRDAWPLAAWIARFACDPMLASHHQWVDATALQPLYVRNKVAQTIAERRQVSDLAWADMTPADVASVMVIERQAYPFPWTSGNFLDSLKAGYTMKVLKERGVMIGYLVWMRVVDEVHLLNVALSPARQGRGLGAWMMRQLMDQVRAIGIDQILLEVRPSNTSAIRLYRKLGFEDIGRRKGYYPNSAASAVTKDPTSRQTLREDAIVMRKSGLISQTVAVHG